jgi:hypothetical protein|tara:strand:+ start:104 stop:523 length:420 start_codon:yes stop_codon:yes gene_type:complete
MGMTTVLLLMAGYQGLAQISVFGLSHPSLGFLTIMIFALTETFTLTYISALIKSLKQNVKEDQSVVLSQSRSKVYSHGMMSLLWITTVFLLGGAVDTNLLPSFLHGMIFLLGFVHYFYVLKLQHQAFGDCVLIINKLTI